MTDVNGITGPIPPLPPGFTEDEARSIFKRWRNTPNPALLSESLKPLLPWLQYQYQEHVKVTAETKQFLAKVAAEQPEEEGRPPAEIKTGAWLREQRFAPLQWAVSQVVPEGLSIISGKPKAGKSFLVLAWAMAIASGREPSGFPAQPSRPVLYFALEDGDRRMQKRCSELGFDWIPDLFDYVTQADPAQVVITARGWLDAHPDGVVIIDTLAKVRTPRLSGESAYDHDYRVLGTYHALAKAHPGSSVLIVHHTRKEESADFLDATSGTYGISGSVDTVLVLARKRGETDGVLHTVGRDVEEEDYRLTGFPFWMLDGGSPEAARRAAVAAAEREHLGDRSTQLLDYARAHGEITTAQAAELLGTTSADASRLLGRQVQAGRLNRSGRGSFVPGGVFGVSGVLESSEHSNTPHTPGESCARAREDGAIVYDWAALYDASRKKSG